MTTDWDGVERALCRIPHVTHAHVVRDASDQVRELHVLATPGKPAKQVVRDVQSVARASFGVEVDRHVVSVVQLDEEPVVTADDPVGAAAVQERGEPPEQRERTQLSGLTVRSQAGLLAVTVSLRLGDREAEGSTGRPSTASGVHRLCAEAALAALAQLHPAAPPADVEGVEVRRLGSGRVALVRVAQRSAHGDDLLVGTAGVGAAGEYDAVARAVLDAVNRRLADPTQDTSPRRSASATAAVRSPTPSFW